MRVRRPPRRRDPGECVRPRKDTDRAKPAAASITQHGPIGLAGAALDASPAHDAGSQRAKPPCRREPELPDGTGHCPRRAILCKLLRHPDPVGRTGNEILLARLRGRHRPGSGRGRGSKPRAGAGPRGVCDDGRAALARRVERFGSCVPPIPPQWRRAGVAWGLRWHAHSPLRARGCGAPWPS